jgi:hypothetical protein
MTTKTTKRRVYFNQKQIDFVTAIQKIKIAIAGRGWGKSTVISLILLFMLRVMPRAKIFFSSTTIEQIKNSTLPPVLAKLAEMGIHEDKHFVVGKDPWGANSPCKWFKRPISPVKKYDNVITFWNGFTVVMLSAAKPNSQRGGSYDAGIIDEAAFVKRTFWEKVLLKMVRGNLYKFDTHLHHSIFILTSQPRTSDGMWVLAMEQMAATYPDEYLFLWASARDNEVVLGEDWFRTQKQTSSHLDYLLEVENVRLKKLPDGFYHRLDEDRHTYSPIRDHQGRMLDVRDDEMIEVSFDFSGKFNCCSVWQEQEFVERCVRQFFVKERKRIKGLVDVFCEHFKGHRFKYVRLWGEPRGRDRNPIDEDDIFTIIRKRFEFNGWTAEIMVPEGVATKHHKERFTFIETVMDEEEPLIPKVRFNAEACENILLSMQGTDINPDYTKNKSAERDESFPQENAPHFSDTVDYYLYYKHAWRLVNGGNSRAGMATTM